MRGEEGKDRQADPAAGSWTAAGTLNDARRWHTATLLADGRLLLAGGNYNTPLDSAELYEVCLGF